VTSNIFDKTGMLTLGKPLVTDLIHVGLEVEQNQLLWLIYCIACIERNSEHPLAVALLNFSEKELAVEFLDSKPYVQPDDFAATSGRGVSCTANGMYVAIGNITFILSGGASLSPETNKAMEILQDNAKTVFLVTINNEMIAVIGIANEIKPESAWTISYLRKMSIDVWMVTGSNQQAAHAVPKNAWALK
jgi:Cu+-exporting ATPase